MSRVPDLLVVLMGATWTAACGGPVTPPEASASTRAWQTAVVPLLGNFCIGCHGGPEPEGGLDLEPWAAQREPPPHAGLRERAGLVERLAEHVGGGLMPPPGEMGPPAPARAAFASWWLDALARAWAAAPPDPGRVTLRRLNRYEYRRTVQELLGVTFDAEGFFPSDDVGYGFDHIGDVLSMPPILFEKYLEAAERISERAIVIPDAPIRRLQAETMLLGGGSRATEDLAFFFSNSEASATVSFVQGGRYALRVRAWAQQAGPAPARMDVRLGQRVLARHDVRAVRARPGLYETEVRVPAGPQSLSVAFVNDYYRPEDPDPRARDRNLAVDWIELEGPLGVDADPLPDSHGRLLTCEPRPGEEAECARRVLRRLLRRAWRRPARDGELQRYVDLVMRGVTAGESFVGAMRTALQAVLVSPHFLFRVELDERAGAGASVRRLNEHELASRLAYFLWSSLPDQALDAVADAGQLHATVHEQVARMLEDPRAQALVENFAPQWLELRRLERAAPDPSMFPGFDEELRRSMLRETELLVWALVREDRSILDLIDAPFTHVNGRLARHYGLVGVRGARFLRVNVTDPRRAGVLGHASILTLTSYPTRTSPVQRGKWVMDVLLGTPPPPPPPGVGALETQDPSLNALSLRERLQRHREDPRCAVCHDRMDNLGYGLEAFDAVGRLRTKDGALPVDSRGTLPDGRRFDGPAELRGILKRDPNFPRCFAEKLLTYALGRGLEPYDRPAVLRVVEAARAKGLRFSAFVHAVVADPSFTMRRTLGRSP